MSNFEIKLDIPSEEEILKVFYAIENTKHNNEHTFINDGGRASYRSVNDKKCASHAYWYYSDVNNEYEK